MVEAGDDSRAFEALYSSLHPLVIRTVYLVVFDAEVASEITNEAFLRFWQHRQDLVEHANARAWLMRVAHNLAIDHHRSIFTALRHRAPGVPSADPAALAMDRLEIERMRRALLRLRPRERALLALRFDQGLSFPEIARIVDHPEATVRTRLHRALERLRRWLPDPEDSRPGVRQEFS